MVAHMWGNTFFVTHTGNNRVCKRRLVALFAAGRKTKFTVGGEETFGGNSKLLMGSRSDLGS